MGLAGEFFLGPFRDLRKIAWADVRRGFLPATLGYGLTTVALAYGATWPYPPDHRLHPAAAMGLVLLFTVTHGVFPVFFYRWFTHVPSLFLHKMSQFKPPQAAPEAGGPARPLLPKVTPMPLAGMFMKSFAGFGYLHMLVWYGAPSVFLAVTTSWVPLAAAAVHIVLAGRRRFVWVFLEYGATSLSLLVYLSLFGAAPASWPWAILTFLLQGSLLAVMEAVGRPLWVKEEKAELV